MEHVWRAILNTGKLAFRSRLEMPEGWDMHLQIRCCNANSAQHERKRRFRYLAYALGCIVSLCSIMTEERATIYWRFILRSVICYSFFSFSHRTNNILLHSNCARMSNLQKPRPFFVYFRPSKTLMFPLGHISVVFKWYHFFFFRFFSIIYYISFHFFFLPAFSTWRLMWPRCQELMWERVDRCWRKSEGAVVRLFRTERERINKSWSC